AQAAEVWRDGLPPFDGLTKYTVSEFNPNPNNPKLLCDVQGPGMLLAMSAVGEPYIIELVVNMNLDGQNYTIEGSARGVATNILPPIRFSSRLRIQVAAEQSA